MADIKYVYKDNNHPLTSYEEIIDTCVWLETALLKACKDKDIQRSSCHIAFSSGAISYECTSLEEFKRYAFGKECELHDLCVFVHEAPAVITIGAFARPETDRPQQFSIIANDEALIADAVDALKSTASQSLKEHVTIQYEDKSIHIGDGNTIMNSIVGQDNTAETAPSSKESLLSKTFWQILIPIVCGVIVTALCLWFGLSK